MDEEFSREQLLDAVNALTKALSWCTGSADFGPGGKARAGWLKIGEPALEKGRAIVATIEDPASDKVEEAIVFNDAVAYRKATREVSGA